MGHNGSPYDYVIHAALIVRSRVANYQLPTSSGFASALSALASFPGSSAWVDEKEPDTHCLRMLSSPRISGNLEIFRKICSVTLTSARYADFSRIKDGCH